MKKVLIIIGKLKIGGAEKVARDIGYYANKEEYSIDFLVFENEIGEYEEELVQSGCGVIHLNSPSSGYRQYYKSLTNIIKKGQYDIVHSHTMFNSGWAMMVAKKQKVATRICHAHSIRGNEKRGFIKNLYENVMRVIILKYSTDYLACGEAAGKWLYGEKFFEKKGKIILNGIDTLSYKYHQEFRRQIRHKHNIQDKYVIGHVGHLAPVKNQIFLVELLPDIIKIKNNAVLLLLGEGLDRKKIETRIAELKLQDRVIMTGNVKEVNKYLSAMDVFAFPSFYEGTPLALIEVQANGLPAVISDKIPKDVCLTDLICSESLDNRNEWISKLTGLERKDVGKYEETLKNSVFNSQVMLKEIYQIYEGKKNEI